MSQTTPRKSPSKKRKKTPREKPIRPISRIPKLPPRPKHAHKGDFGRVLILAGSRGMIGAPALVANAALRSGAGLVTAACPAAIQPSVATLCPCATTIPLPQTRRGLIDPAKALGRLTAAGLLNPHAAPTVLAAGPGLGQGGPAVNRGWARLLDAFARQAEIPLVLDADALNALSKTPVNMMRRLGPNYVITPHPGEMARLRGITSKDVQANRRRLAVDTARWLAAGPDRRSTRAAPIRAAPVSKRSRAGRLGADLAPVVVLKGAGTLVTDGRRLYTNKTGNPGMATGGSGDVLTGVIAALIAQGLSPFDAAVLGVFAHGQAGDLAARDLGPTSLIATDLIDYLPHALR